MRTEGITSAGDAQQPTDIDGFRRDALAVCRRGGRLAMELDGRELDGESDELRAGRLKLMAERLRIETERVRLEVERLRVARNRALHRVLAGCSIVADATGVAAPAPDGSRIH